MSVVPEVEWRQVHLLLIAASASTGQREVGLPLR